MSRAASQNKCSKKQRRVNILWDSLCGNHQDAWNEMLRWNRSRKTGLRYENLKAAETILPGVTAQLTITDLNVDTTRIEARKQERKDDLCRKALSKLL